MSTEFYRVPSPSTVLKFAALFFLIFQSQPACSSFLEDVARNLKKEIKKKSSRKVERSLRKVGLKAPSGSSFKKVTVSKVVVNERVKAQRVALPMKANRFYLNLDQIKAYFGMNLGVQGLVVDQILKGRSSFLVSEVQGSFMKDVVTGLIGKEKRYLVRDIARILNLNVSWNQRTRILSFKNPPLGKGPLDRIWREYLRKKGWLGYLEQIEEILKARRKPSGKREPDSDKPKSGDKNSGDNKDKPAGPVGSIPTDPDVRKMRFQNIYATSFEAQVIASKGPRGDWKMRDTDVGCALPSRSALGETVKIYYPKTKKTILCPVIDVGPWNIKDPYWVNRQRPSAEKGRDERGRKTNLAGIDLSYQAWFLLGVKRDKAFRGVHSDYVHWDFVGE